MSDIRIIKTKQNIEYAFINLLNEKEFKSITINNICQYALTSRSTFYLHYLDKYDLLDQLIKAQLSFFQEIVEQRFTELISGKFEETIVEFYHELIKRRAIIQALFKVEESEYNLKLQFEDILYEHWLAYLNQRLNVRFKELVARIGASIVFDTLTWTFEYGLDEEALVFVEEIRTKIFEIPKSNE